MNLLDTIIAQKKREVAKRKKAFPVKTLESGRYFERKTRSLAKSILDTRKTGIIAEFKRKSPSRGWINGCDSVESVTQGYTAFGASGISILTDYTFFGGSLDDLLAARDNDLPLLRKEFIIDAYQVIEAKAFGADAILLIASCLDRKSIREFTNLAGSLGMEVLLEIHDEEELDAILPGIGLVGVNNRNLKTFETDLEQGVRLVSMLGDDVVKVAESGIGSVEDLLYLRRQGFQGFLIGEYFMRQQNPAQAFKDFSYAL